MLAITARTSQAFLATSHLDLANGILIPGEFEEELFQRRLLNRVVLNQVSKLSLGLNLSKNCVQPYGCISPMEGKVVLMLIFE